MKTVETVSYDGLKNHLPSQVFIIFFLVSLTACQSHSYHAFDFNATSNAYCVMECEELMQNYSCIEALPAYSSSFTNGEQIIGICSCYVRGCRK